MMRRIVVALAVVVTTVSFEAASPIHYTLSFPEAHHRWMQVEATFPGVAQPTLELRMSRSSPGRYSLHDFAKNVYDIHAFSADGREYIIYLESGESTPAPWVNVVANRHLGFVVSESGGGYTWAENSGENRLTA